MPDDRLGTYLLLHRLSSLKRTGWVDYGVEEPETVMCHMYDAWLLGRLFLPDTSEEEGYDKDRILDMLLIHDLAESVTGDIITPLKDRNPDYDVREGEAMEGILASLSEDGRLRDLWDEWTAQRTFSSVVAKDLDVLQSIVQYCLYRRTTGSLATDEATANWLGKRSRLRTDVALEIYDRVIPPLMDMRDPLLRSRTGGTCPADNRHG